MLMVCILGTRAMRVCVHTAWATVLLFGTKGNTRASGNGTARLQSRFFRMLVRSTPIISRSWTEIGPRLDRSWTEI